MLEICAIASGSNGNCYYIGNERGSVLVDAGISCKQILQRMDERGLNPARIQAVFISHEHIDHLRGARVLAKNFMFPYISRQKHSMPQTARFVRLIPVFSIPVKVLLLMNLPSIRF